ncbi:hypothetical protein E4U59_000334 [Claviceps monticola]|nr:hypothetical protein E4U59_000334 [Claviceps monticola]
MPISDLLAQISGGKANNEAAPPLRRTSSVPAKRRADEDLRKNDFKAPRVVPSGAVSAKPKAPQGQYTGSARPSSTTLGSKPASSVPNLAKDEVSSRLSQTPAAAATTTRPPKKGSFAEILARGQRAQAVMGQVGKIQHKKVEKGAVKKSRDELPPSSTPAKGRAAASGGYAGTAKPAQRVGDKGVAARPLAVGRGKGKAATAVAAAEAARKLKRAASATTGYTGTARPKPDSQVRKGDVPRGGALLTVPRHTVPKSKREEDDYDEELDDFIEYDDEEDDAGGPRYGYASDGSSDMEAGLEDIDHEERRAEYIGRREDLEEERLEKTLKSAKEERKRRALEQMRARRR